MPLPPLHVVRLPHGEGLPLPCYATPGSAGMDLLAATTEDHVLEPGARWVCPTGLRVAIPQGFEGQVRSRSGWALKHGIVCINSPGTIDSDYRGEVGVLLANLGAEPVTITRGTRVAQFVLAPVTQLAWREVEALDATERGAGGFGSTGTA